MGPCCGKDKVDPNDAETVLRIVNEAYSKKARESTDRACM